MPILCSFSKAEKFPKVEAHRRREVLCSTCSAKTDGPTDPRIGDAKTWVRVALFPFGFWALFLQRGTCYETVFVDLGGWDWVDGFFDYRVTDLLVDSGNWFGLGNLHRSATVHANRIEAFETRVYVHFAK